MISHDASNPCSATSCIEHKFELRASNLQCPQLPSVSIHFCPIYSQHNRSFQNTFPVFNQDQQDFSAAFILPSDRDTNLKNAGFEKDAFLHRIQQELNSHSSHRLNIPAPTNPHCHICGLNYQEYFEHINTLDHKKRLRQSAADEFIQQLCLPFKLKNSLLLQKCTKARDTRQRHCKNRDSLTNQIKFIKSKAVPSENTTMTSEKKEEVQFSAVLRNKRIKKRRII